MSSEAVAYHQLGAIRISAVSGALVGVDVGPHVIASWTLAVVGVVLATLLAVQRYRAREEEVEGANGTWLGRLLSLPEVAAGSGAGALPEAFSLPLIGSASLLTGLPHLVVTRMVDAYGKVFRLNAGGDRKFVVVNDVGVIRDAMARHGTALSGKPRSTTTEMTNAGAQRDMGRRWARRRYVTMSAFRAYFRQCPDHIRDVCRDELTSLVLGLRAGSPPPAARDPTPEVTYFVARTMWRLVYGRGRRPDARTCERLRALSAKIDDYTKNAGPFSLLDRFPTLKRFLSGSMDRYRDAVNFMNRFCDECDAERRGGAHPEVAAGGDDRSRDLMTYMMRGASSLTAEDERQLGLTPDLLFAGVADLIRAGTESPSLLLIWICLLLAKHPDVQRRMRDELDDYREPEAEVPTVCEASADRTPYSHAVVYETIRYCAVVPFLKRRCLADVIIGGHRLPAGTNIIINNHAISHDPARWGDPENFRPDRFLDADGAFDACRLEDFLPFGIGKRRCMGEEIGKLLPFAAISTLVLNFDISAPEPVDLTPAFGITLTPKKQQLVFTNLIQNAQTERKS